MSMRVPPIRIRVSIGQCDPGPLAHVCTGLRPTPWQAWPLNYAVSDEACYGEPGNHARHVFIKRNESGYQTGYTPR